MAMRYIQIHELNEAHHDEIICAVYNNPTLNATGTRGSERIIGACRDAAEGKCRLMVWRDDDNKAYYQALDEGGRIRDKEAPCSSPALNLADIEKDLDTALKMISHRWYGNAAKLIQDVKERISECVTTSSPI